MLQKSRSHSKFKAPEVWHKVSFHAEDFQILGPTVQNLVAQAAWRPGDLRIPNIKAYGRVVV
jgi:hypothetical protein